MVTSKFSWLLKDLDLTAKVTQCCTYASGGCATKPAARCYTPTAKRSVDFEEENASIVEETAAVVEDAELVQEVEFSAASVAYPAAFLVAVALAILF